MKYLKEICYESKECTLMFFGMLSVIIECEEMEMYNNGFVKLIMGIPQANITSPFKIMI